MQLMAHFFISLAIAFALEMKVNRKYLSIIFLGVIGVLPDIDHILPRINDALIFHNMLFFCVLPFLLIFLITVYENRAYPASSKYQRMMISVAVILLAHLLLDLIDGNIIYVDVFKAGSTFQLVSFPLLEVQGVGNILYYSDIAWLLLMVIVIIGNLSQKVIYDKIEVYTRILNGSWRPHFNEKFLSMNVLRNFPYDKSNNIS